MNCIEMTLITVSVCVCLCMCVFQSGRHDEAWMILRQVHDTNWKAKGEPERVFTVSLNLYIYVNI